MCFFTFPYPSHLKHIVLRACLEDCLPEILSKLGVLAETSMKKSNKHHATAALGGCGGLGQLWEALAELWEALGGSEQQLLTPDLGESRGSADEFQIVQILCVFTARVTRVTLWCNVFVYFFIPL